MSEKKPLSFEEIVTRIKIYPLSKLKDEVNLTPELMKETDLDGRTLFFWACGEGKIEIAEYLYNLGSDVNQCDEGQWTPLHISASLGRENIVRFLLLHGAHINAQTESLQTPLHYAASRGNLQQFIGFTEIVKLLLDFNQGMNNNLI